MVTATPHALRWGWGRGKEGTETKALAAQSLTWSECSDGWDPEIIELIKLITTQHIWALFGLNRNEIM